MIADEPIQTSADAIALRAMLRAMTSPPSPLSQRAAARRLGVDETTMRRWLASDGSSSRRDPPYAAVELLRRILAEES